MKTPLEEFGLDLDADERMLKKAYGLRLKSARPDEDAEGFQRLNELYKAALSQINWRERSKADDSPHDRAVASNGSNDRQILDWPPHDTVNAELVVSTSHDPATAAFELDLETFIQSLKSAAEEKDAAGFRDWLVAITADWPLVTKPAIAGRILWELQQDHGTINPQQLDAVAMMFSLEDVLVNYDALGLQLLREQVTQDYENRKLREHVGELLRPGNRKQLVRYMEWTGNGEYASPLTRFFAWLLTQRHALNVAKIFRWLPFVTRGTSIFIFYLGQNNPDLLSPAIDQKVVHYWLHAEERRIASRPFRRFATVMALLVGFLYFTHQSPTDRDQTINTTLTSAPPEETQQPSSFYLKALEGNFLDRHNNIRTKIEPSDNIKAIDEYKKLISEMEKHSWTPVMEHIVANSYYSIGYLLEINGSKSEAERIYIKVKDKFVNTSDSNVSLLRIWSMVNLAWMHNDAMRYREAIELFELVRLKTQDADNPALRLQQLKSVRGESLALLRSGDLERAFALVTNALNQYGKGNDPQDEADISAIRQLEAQISARLSSIRSATELELELNKQIDAAVVMPASVEKVLAYDKVIAALPKPAGKGLERTGAIAMYNKGVTLDRLKRTLEARRIYAELEDRFSTATNLDAMYQVVSGLRNLGQIEMDTGNTAAAHAAFDKILTPIFAATGDTRIEGVIAQAYEEKIGLFRRQGDKANTRQTVEAATSRFAYLGETFTNDDRPAAPILKRIADLRGQLAEGALNSGQSN